jgi:hypothetical protein
VGLSTSFRACRFFRSTWLGRRAASLCLFVIFFNLLGPIFWVSAHEPLHGTETLCLASASHQNTNGTAPQDDATIIHCPLCVLLVGSIAAPPTEAPSVTVFASTSREAFRVFQESPFAPLPFERHPPPRGPPAFG